jgi:hypothetical protein
MTPELARLRLTLLTAPRGSAEILDAIDRLVDLGLCCLADEAVDEREQVEAVEDDRMPLRRKR